jgi:hypothetical protein
VIPGLRRDRKEERPVALLGIGREAPREEAHRRVAVDEGVVDLRVHREPPPLQALNKVELPRRAPEVDGLLVKALHEDAKLALIARRRERGAADVDLEIQVGFFDPRLKGV